MSEPQMVVQNMCEAYAAAVNASDAATYSKLFAPDAIRMPPGAEPERGPEQIRQGEQVDYDAARLSIRSTPGDALQTGDGWIYAIAYVEGTATPHSGGEPRAFRATKTWLLQEQPSGDWLIARQMWNMKPTAT